MSTAYWHLIIGPHVDIVREGNLGSGSLAFICSNQARIGTCNLPIDYKLGTRLSSKGYYKESLLIVPLVSSVSRHCIASQEPRRQANMHNIFADSALQRQYAFKCRTRRMQSSARGKPVILPRTGPLMHFRTLLSLLPTAM